MTKHNTTLDHRYYFSSRPPIRPYICSTPRDFIEERNYLAETIFPQLDHLCFTRGTSFRPVDLKWLRENRCNNVNFKSHVRHITHDQLKLCLDYINSSSPFFICILGHTYGEFVPESQIQVSSDSDDLPDDAGLSEVEKNLLVAANGGYPWVLVESKKTCSFTELEVIQALLLKDTASKYFYFRDYQYIEDKIGQADEDDKWRILSSFASENEEEETRIWELKASIVDKGLPVRFFKTKEELGTLVLKDWSDVIEKLYPLSNTPVNIGHEYNLAQAYHQAYAENLCKDFVGSQGLNKLFAALDTFACGHLQNQQSKSMASSRVKNEKSILLLHGGRGCGKSTAVAKWMHLFKRHSRDVLVISYFVGSRGRSDDIMGFMRHCIVLLQCDYFGIQMEDFYSNENINDLWEFQRLVDVFLASVALKPCVLVLDGMDELCGTHVNAQQAKGFDWLPTRLPHHCKVIMTTRNHHLSYKRLISRSDIQIEELEIKANTDERLCIFHKHLAMPSRKVPNCLMESFENKKMKISPLQLAVLASELQICPNVVYCIDNPLETLSTEQLWSLLIKHWAKHYSWPCEKRRMKNKTPKSAFGSDIHNSGWVVDVLCLLTTSHCGLHEDDILQMLKKMGYENQYEVTTLHWAAFRLATSKWIWEKPDGLLQIYHQSFHDAIVHLLFGLATPVSESLDYTFQNTVSRKRKHFHHFLLKYFQQSELSRQTCDEVPWHLRMTGKLHDLYRFLLNPSTLDLIRRNMKHGCQMKMDLIHYWQMLLYSGHDPVVECQTLLHNIAEQAVDLNNQCKVMLFAAQCLKDIGKTKDAGSILSSIEHRLESAESRNNKVLMWTQKTSGDLYRDIGSWQEAVIYYEKALDNLQRLNLQNNYRLLRLRERLSCLKTTLKAQICYEQRSEILEHPIEQLQPHKTGPYEQAALKLWQSLYKFCIGDIFESEKYLVDCLDIRRKLYGKNHILCGEVQEYLADIQIHLESNNYTQRHHAIKNYRNVIKIIEDTEKCSPSLEIKQYLRLHLSSTLVKSGKLLSYDLENRKESVEMLQRSLDLRTSIVGTDHPLTYEVQLYLKELNCRPFWSSRVPALLEDNKHPPIKSEVSQRKSYSAQPRRHHLTSEYGRTYQTSLHSLFESRSDDFLIRRCSSRELMTHSIKDHSLRSNQEKELFCEQISNSEEVAIFSQSKFPGKRPASVTSCLTHSLCSRSESACQTPLSGPHSDLLSLVSLSRSPSKSKQCQLVHKSAWYHVPGRYPTLQTPFPPKRHQIRKDI